MFFTAHKQKNRKLNGSNSKDSKQSIISASKKTQPSVMMISTAELKLREAINKKFQKSDINDFRYKCNIEAPESETSSIKSDQMQEYQNLKGRRFINIKDYHYCRKELLNCKYMIRRRQADQRRPRVSSQADTLSPIHSVNPMKKNEESKLFLPPQLSYSNERRTLSGQKKQQWQKIGFESHSASKNMDKKKYKQMSPGKGERYQSRLFYFRREEKAKTESSQNY